MNELFLPVLTVTLGVVAAGCSIASLILRLSPPDPPDFPEVSFPPTGWGMAAIDEEESDRDCGEVLVGDSDESRIQKLAADVIDGVRERARQEAVVKAGEARCRKKGEGVVFEFKLILNDREICYRRTFSGETWDIAKLAFGEVFWYHTLLNYLIEESVNALTYALERTDSSTFEE